MRLSRENPPLIYPILAARWSVVHGLPRALIRYAAKKGDPQAALIADEGARLNPFPLYEQLRARGPVHSSRLSHTTVDYEVVNQVLRSDDFHSISFGENLPGVLGWIERNTRVAQLHPVREPSLLAVEPPEHTRYRKLVASVFTARAVAALRERVQARADELLDTLDADAKAGRTVDIVERYCGQLPVAVISDILGVPQSERARMLELGGRLAPSLDFGMGYRTFVSTERALIEFDRWLTAHLRSLQKNPGDDLLSQLIAATEDGRGLSDSELRATAGLVLAAGFETTVNLLGSGTRLLLDNPAQLQRLMDDPTLWSTAVDEVLRMESPVQITARVAKLDTEVAGRAIARGEVITLSLAGANRDPKIFADPGTFDVGRENANRHMAFSIGRHFCLGAALARAEGEVGLGSLFARFPQMRLAAQGTRRGTRVLRGWTSLPVTLGAPARELSHH